MERMHTHLPFTETQRFRNSWIIYLVLFADLFTIGIVVLVMSQGETDSTEYTPWIVLPVPLLITALLWIATLTTTIDKQGISIRFYPFHLQPRSYSWRDIASVKTGEYTLMQTGGYGIRKIKGGWGYNVSGSDCIWIEMKDGVRYLIGTQQPAAMQAAIDLATEKQTTYE